jgi:membrane protein involved in colicin uptake
MANTQYQLLQQFRLCKRAAAAMPSGNVPTTQPASPPAGGADSPGSGLASVVGKGAGGIAADSPGFRTGQQAMEAAKAEEDQKSLDQLKKDQEAQAQKMLQQQQREAERRVRQAEQDKMRQVQMHQKQVQQAAQQAQKQQEAAAEAKRESETLKMQLEAAKTHADIGQKLNEERGKMMEERMQHQIGLKENLLKHRDALDKQRSTVAANSFLSSKSKALVDRASALKSAAERLGKGEAVPEYWDAAKAYLENCTADVVAYKAARIFRKQAVLPGPQLPNTITNVAAGKAGEQANQGAPMKSAPATPAATTAQPPTPPAPGGVMGVLAPTMATQMDPENPASKAYAENPWQWINDPKNNDPRSIRHWMGSTSLGKGIKQMPRLWGNRAWGGNSVAEREQQPWYTPERLAYGISSLPDLYRNQATFGSARLQEAGNKFDKAFHGGGVGDFVAGVGHTGMGALDAWGLVPVIGGPTSAAAKGVIQNGIKPMVTNTARYLGKRVAPRLGAGVAADAMSQAETPDIWDQIKRKELGFDPNDPAAWDAWREKLSQGKGGQKPTVTQSSTAAPGNEYGTHVLPHVRGMALQQSGYLHSNQPGGIINPLELEQMPYKNTYGGIPQALMGMFGPKPNPQEWGWGGGQQPNDSLSAMQSADRTIFGRQPGYMQMFR